MPDKMRLRLPHYRDWETMTPLKNDEKAKRSEDLRSVDLALFAVWSHWSSWGSWALGLPGGDKALREADSTIAWIDSHLSPAQIELRWETTKVKVLELQRRFEVWLRKKGDQGASRNKWQMVDDLRKAIKEMLGPTEAEAAMILEIQRAAAKRVLEPFVGHVLKAKDVEFTYIEKKKNAAKQQALNYIGVPHGIQKEPEKTTLTEAKKQREELATDAKDQVITILQETGLIPKGPTDALMERFIPHAIRVAQQFAEELAPIYGTIQGVKDAICNGIAAVGSKVAASSAADALSQIHTSSDPAVAVERLAERLEDIAVRKSAAALRGVGKAALGITTLATGGISLVVEASVNLALALQELVEVHGLIQAAIRERDKTNALLKNNEIGTDILKSSPLLAAYYIGACSKSDILLLAADLGGVMWIDRIENINKWHIERLRAAARRIVDDSLLELDVDVNDPLHPRNWPTGDGSKAVQVPKGYTQSSYQGFGSKP